MIEQVGKLPNFYNGKIYKRWDRVMSVHGGGLLASRTDKKGETLELLISPDGDRRELFSRTGKILDCIDDSGIQRTYCYEKLGDEIRGTMVVAPVPEAIKPLVTFAKWVNHGLLPKFVELDLNPKHKAAKVFIPKGNETWRNPVILDNGKAERAVKVKAEDFADENFPLPKKLTFTTEKGEQVVIAKDTGMDNLMLANRLGLTNQGEPGMNMQVMV